MVSLRFTYAKLATVIRLYSPVQYIFEERARNWLEDPRLRFHSPRSRVFLVRIRSHSIISRRISNEMGTGFA